VQKVKRGGVVIVGLLLRAGVGVWGEKDWAPLDFLVGACLGEKCWNI